jgi:hypothetical protein
MAERLEYSGDSLPTGLPGFGGGTVDVLTLPGFNRVVAAQKFGPVNDAPNITVPDSTAPIGSNPEDPTDEVVTPGPAPLPTGTPNIGAALASRLKKRPPCEDAFTFFGSLQGCGIRFEPFVVCDGGNPVENYLLRFDPEALG